MQLYWAFCVDERRVDAYNSLSAAGAAAMHAAAQAPMLNMPPGMGANVGNGNEGGGGADDNDNDTIAGLRAAGLLPMRNGDLFGRLSGGLGGGLNGLSSLQLAQLAQEPGTLMVDELTIPSMGVGINFGGGRGMPRMGGMQQMGGGGLNGLSGLQGLGVNVSGLDTLTLPVELRQLPLSALNQLPIAEMQLQGGNLKQLLYMNGHQLHASGQGGGADEPLSASRLNELLSPSGKRALSLTSSLALELGHHGVPMSMSMAPPSGKRPRVSGDSGGMMGAPLELAQLNQLNKLSEMSMPALLNTLRAAGLSNVQ